MADTVWDKAISNLADALRGISKSNGYNFDVSGVFFWGVSGFPNTGNLPEIIIVDSRQTIISRSGVDVERWRRQVIIEMALDLFPDADDQDYSREYQKGLADIAKSILSDPYRGGNAVDTLIDEAIPHVYEEAGAMGVIVTASIQFGHKANDLYTQA